MASKETCNFSHITNHCFPSSQLAWTRVKLIWGTGPNDCSDAKSNWVAFTSKKMHLEHIFLIVRNEN